MRILNVNSFGPESIRLSEKRKKKNLIIKKYTEQKKKRHMHIWSMFSRHVNNFLQILFYAWIQIGLHCQQNEYYYRSFKSDVRNQFDVRKGQNLKMQFKRAF